MTDSAVLGGGCFWCLEAVYQQIDGVLAVESGYAGGTVSNPTYEAVCTGNTGHAEVVRITFEDSVLTYEAILEIFFGAHDPTTLNRQGADVGSQYRSLILYRDTSQQKVAQRSFDQAQKNFSKPIVTQLEPLAGFWVAEPYHQNYFRSHPENGYCRAIIAPKLKSLL